MEMAQAHTDVIPFKRYVRISYVGWPVLNLAVRQARQYT